MSSDPTPSKAPAPKNKEQENAIDQELMRRTQEGDIKAFEELILRHQNAIIGTAAKMLKNHAEAEDIAQQTFVRLWKSAHRYRAEAKFTTYLYTIMRNLVFNESSRMSKKKMVSTDEKAEESHFDISDREEYQPDKEALQSELQKNVDIAINELPESQRMAIVLRKYEQLSYDDIAEVMDISVSAVKSQLFRARGALKVSLASYLDKQ
ncbi:sigma-70 family RNA polymerase sigma factor [Akkermansiaceae bacterium]|nr:sigma-70 family RNA polymerase sigma factor [Akkermansiaceae bacterium]